LYVRNAYFLLQEVDVTEEEKRYTIDLRPFMNPSPYTVQHVSTVHPIHESVTIYSSVSSVQPQCFSTYALYHKDVWESGGIAPLVSTSTLAGGERARFMSSPLYLQGKIPQYPLCRRLGGPPEESNLMLLPEIEPWQYRII
jgi:hypothetical protein